LLLLLTIILTSTANSVEVTTGNLLSNSTFGTGTTYSNENWTITSEDYHNNTSIGGGNDPGGSVAADNATNIEQTISSLSSAAEMTVNEIRRGFSSKLSADIWYWNQFDNTTTLKQTITDNEGNVTTQQRVIPDTGCGSINCGSYTNYTDTYVQGTNTKDDFSIKVNVSNANSRGGAHWGPDIDDIELRVTYTDVPPIEEDTQEELDEITEEIDDVVEDIEENVEWEYEYTWEDDFTWEETYFEEEFNTVWEDYGIEFNDEMYFEEEFVEFSEEIVFEEEFIEEFDTTMTMEENFFEMDMEMEEAWEMPEDYEMTEMDTFFTEMSEDEWEDIETMSDEEFEEFLEEEFPEEFAEMQEESMEMEETVEMEEEMVFNNEETTEPPEEMIEEEEPEEMEVAENDSESTEETAEAVEEEPESEESPQEVAADEGETDGEESIASDEPIEEEKTVAVKKEKIETVKEKIKAKIELIKINEIKVAEIKPTLFSNQPNLEEYSNVSFYAPVELNYEVNDAFFEQMSLDMYNQQIYGDVTLANYTQNDAVEVHRKKLEEISMKKRAIMIELEQLRGN